MQIRLHPVTLVTGAGAGFGAACALEFARRSHGGLILADFDEAALRLVADEVDARGAAPERVSTMAIEADASPARWNEAADFIQSQYGRLDWAIINLPTPNSELLQFGADARPVLENAAPVLQTAMDIMRKNSQGGAIVLIAPAAVSQSPTAFLHLVRALAATGAHDNVRINAIAAAAKQAPQWESAPHFQDIVRELGAERPALERVSMLSPAVARYGGHDITRLIVTLTAEEAPITGATLIVDGAAAL